MKQRDNQKRITEQGILANGNCGFRDVFGVAVCFGTTAYAKHAMETSWPVKAPNANRPWSLACLGSGAHGALAFAIFSASTCRAAHIAGG